MGSQSQTRLERLRMHARTNLPELFFWKEKVNT